MLLCRSMHCNVGLLNLFSISFKLPLYFSTVFLNHISSPYPSQGFSKPFNIYVHTDSLEGSSSPAEANNRWIDSFKLPSMSNFKVAEGSKFVFAVLANLPVTPTTFAKTANFCHFLDLHCACICLCRCCYHFICRWHTQTRWGELWGKGFHPLLDIRYCFCLQSFFFAGDSVWIMSNNLAPPPLDSLQLLQRFKVRGSRGTRKPCTSNLFLFSTVLCFTSLL